MSLSIKISGHGTSKHYYPGDVVCGVIKLRSKQDSERVETLSISFVGRALVQLTRVDHQMVTATPICSTSCGYLFRQNLVLERFAEMPTSGSLVWPFVFQIPLQAVSDQLHATSDALNGFDYESPWKGSADSESHNLPPTMQHSSMGLDYSVEYGLTARLLRPPCANVQGIQNRTASAEIIVKSAPNLTCIAPGQPDVDPREVTFNSVERLFTDLHASKLGSAKGLARRCMQNKVAGLACQCPKRQSAKLHVKLNLPTKIDLSDTDPIPISLSASVPTPSICSDCTRPQHDTIAIEKMILDLHATTRVRAGMPIQRMTHSATMNLGKTTFQLPLVHKPDLKAFKDHSCSSTDASEDDTYTTLNGIGKLARSYVDSFHREGKIVQEFSTYNIFRAYSLSVKMKLHFAGKTLLFEQDKIPVEIVNGAEYQGDSGAARRSPIEGRRSSEGSSRGYSCSLDIIDERYEEGESPPAYSP